METIKNPTMPTLSVEELRSQLSEQYTPTATSWENAGDDVRDLCRYARQTLALDETHAVDFKKLKTPGEWNTQGVAGIVRFYQQMTEAQRVEFVVSNSWIWRDA